MEATQTTRTHGKCGRCGHYGSDCHCHLVREYEVECVNMVEASSPEQAVLQVAAMHDDGGSYRMGYRVRRISDGFENFIDAEEIDEELDS